MPAAVISHQFNGATAACHHRLAEGQHDVAAQAYASGLICGAEGGDGGGGSVWSGCCGEVVAGGARVAVTRPVFYGACSKLNRVACAVAQISRGVDRQGAARDAQVGAGGAVGGDCYAGSSLQDDVARAQS